MLRLGGAAGVWTWGLGGRSGGSLQRSAAIAARRSRARVTLLRATESGTALRATSGRGGALGVLSARRRGLRGRAGGHGDAASAGCLSAHRQGAVARPVVCGARGAVAACHGPASRGEPPAAGASVCAATATGRAAAGGSAARCAPTVLAAEVAQAASAAHRAAIAVGDGGSGGCAHTGGHVGALGVGREQVHQRPRRERGEREDHDRGEDRPDRTGDAAAEGQARGGRVAGER